MTNEYEILKSAAHVWYVCPAAIDAEGCRQRFLAWLTTEERAKWGRLAAALLQHDFLVSRVLCRLTLSRYAGIDPREWTFDVGAHGKPAIASPAPWTSLRFNLTHTADLAACMVTCAGEVGIDAEETSRQVDVGAVARESLSPPEFARFQGLPEERRAEALFEYWVLKEAYLKGVGVGLMRPLEEVTIDLAPDGSPLPLDDWQLMLHRPTPRHVAATALHRPGGGAKVPVTWRVAEECYKLASPS